MKLRFFSKWRLHQHKSENHNVPLKHMCLVGFSDRNTNNSNRNEAEMEHFVVFLGCCAF